MHSETLFHLVPVDAYTRAVLSHSDNRHVVSQTASGEVGLEIGYHVPARPAGGRVITRLGRDADLILPAPNISGIHFAFEVHPESGALLFCARARDKSSVSITPYGLRENDEGDFRQLVLDYKERDYRIIAGDMNQGIKPCFNFHLVWRFEAVDLPSAIQQAYTLAEKRAVNPRLLRTVENEPGIQSWYNTRLRSNATDIKRATLVKELGHGAFGVVFQGVDWDSGNVIAVKVVRPRNEREKMNLHREIKALENIKHPHIIEYFGSSGWNEERVHIYLPLRKGSVEKLFPAVSQWGDLLDRFLHQMLCALDYLASRNLCHRDVKPANILYDIRDGGYWFQLSDFGLVNHERQALTQCGTQPYQAPELWKDPPAPQTPKMDVWSLFASTISLVPSVGWKEENYPRYSDSLAVIRNAARKFPKLSPMAREEVELRASAAQMLVDIFSGDGLTTRLEDVGRIPEIPPPPPLADPGPTAPSGPSAQSAEIPRAGAARVTPGPLAIVPADNAGLLPSPPAALARPLGLAPPRRPVLLPTPAAERPVARPAAPNPRARVPAYQQAAVGTPPKGEAGSSSRLAGEASLLRDAPRQRDLHRVTKRRSQRTFHMPGDFPEEHRGY